ncbi:hypothetical protein GOODEAATRI_018299, partial [Goodea atripinnis]
LAAWLQQLLPPSLVTLANVTIPVVTVAKATTVVDTYFYPVVAVTLVVKATLH